MESTASADGIALLSTNGLRCLRRYNIKDGSATVSNKFDGLIIGVSLDAGASSQTAVLGDLSQIVLQVLAVLILTTQVRLLL